MTKWLCNFLKTHPDVSINIAYYPDEGCIRVFMISHLACSSRVISFNVMGHLDDRINDDVIQFSIMEMYKEILEEHKRRIEDIDKMVNNIINA